MIKNELKNVFNVKYISNKIFINSYLLTRISLSKTICKLYYVNIGINKKMETENKNKDNKNIKSIDDLDKNIEENRKYSINVNLFCIEKINFSTGVYKFRYLSENKEPLKQMINLKSCQNVKLTLENEERYYSLINVPKINSYKLDSKSYYTTEFHMLIKENQNVPDKNMSFPFLLRKY